MPLISENTKSKDLKKFIESEYNDAFSYVSWKKINELTWNIRIITKWILDLWKEYNLDIKAVDFKNQLFDKLNKSDNLTHVGIWNIIYHIIWWERDCNNCMIVDQFKELQELAITDKLTGLYNRRPIEEEIEKQIHIKKRSGLDSVILMIDIDYFKQINDNYWHTKWDEVLVEIAKLFKQKTRLEDTIGRMWGEEFVIILPWINIEDWEKVAEKIRKEIEMNLSKNVKWIEKTITISIWITPLSKEDNTWKKAQDRADRALYEAKNNWRNKVCIKIKKEKK